MRKSIVLASAIGLLLAGCTSGTLAPSATVTTLTPGADEWFRLTWEPVEDYAGTHVRLRGYVGNIYGEAVGRVQLLAQALDTTGSVVDQKVVWVPGAVPAFSRVYYETPPMRAANSYRVTIWAYERRKFF